MTEEEHRAEERTHWAKLESRALYLNVVTGVGAFVGLAGLVILYSTLVDANRGWMTTIEPHYNADGYTNGRPIAFDFSFANQGREPAIDVTIKIHFDTISAPQGYHDTSNTEMVADNVCDMGLPPFVQSSVAPPGPLSMIQFVMTNTHGSNVVWDDALNSGHTVLRAKGCVSYITFSKRRYTWFCKLFLLLTGERDNHPSREGIGVGCNGGDGAT